MSGCTYYIVDVEATGPVPGLYSLVSLGAVVVRPDAQGALGLGETFYVEFMPVFPGRDPDANAIHGLDLARLEVEGAAPAEGLTRLTEFVERTCAPGTEPTFVGHVAVFDWMYVAWHYAWCGLRNPFGYKGIDAKSMAMGALGLAWPETSKEILAARLGLPEQDPTTLHRADADARHQARLWIALLRRAGLAP